MRGVGALFQAGAALHAFGGLRAFGAAQASDDIPWPPCGGSPDCTLDQLTPPQLGRLAGLELQDVERLKPVPLTSLYEFQQVEELDCSTRLLYLANASATLGERVAAVHTKALESSSIFFALLKRLPLENSWVWMLGNLQERLAHELHSYWSRVVMLALDQHKCLPAQVRDSLLEGLVKWKKLHADWISEVWNGFAFSTQLGGNPKPGRPSLEGLSSEHLAALREEWTSSDYLLSASGWFANVREWVDGFVVQVVRATLSAIQAAKPSDDPSAARSYHQDEHGSFVTYEFLRRRTFNQWAIDKGLLRGLLRHVWQPDYSAELLTIGDFGAGGGHYSTWLNETGLVRSFAFDGTHEAAKLTGGVVQEVNLVQELHLWRTFDWALCLEVGEHVPKQFSSTLLQNLKRHGRRGLVMSWSDDWEGIGHVSCLARDDFVALVQNETGFVYDPVSTEAVRKSCEIDYIARTIAVFRAPTASS